MEYKGKISGIGNSATRNNEITADDLAILRNHIFGWDYGVLDIEGYNFNADKDGDNIVLEKGVMFAYGYLGMLPEPITIPFIKTSAIQYRIIYAEIDRSVVPNTFKIKVKNNQGSDKIKPTTFRQDYLTAVRTGVFQLPLWQVKLDSSGIVDIDGLVNKRDLKKYIKQVEQSNITTKKVTGIIFNGAEATTQSTNDKSLKIATTKFVYDAIIDYMDKN